MQGLADAVKALQTTTTTLPNNQTIAEQLDRIAEPAHVNNQAAP